MKLDGVRREVVGDVAFAAHGLAVVFERRVEVFAPMAGGEAVVFVEAARVWMIRPLRAVVPFSKSARRVARGLECIGERLLVRVQTLPPGRDAAHTAARMITSGKKLGARRRANRADKKAVERCAGARDGIDVGRAQIRVAGKTEIAPPGIVGEEDDDVGPARFRSAKLAADQG